MHLCSEHVEPVIHIPVREHIAEQLAVCGFAKRQAMTWGM